MSLFTLHPYYGQVDGVSWDKLNGQHLLPSCQSVLALDQCLSGVSAHNHTPSNLLSQLYEFRSANFGRKKKIPRLDLSCCTERIISFIRTSIKTFGGTLLTGRWQGSVLFVLQSLFAEIYWFGQFWRTIFDLRNGNYEGSAVLVSITEGKKCVCVFGQSLLERFTRRFTLGMWVWGIREQCNCKGWSTHWLLTRHINCFCIWRCEQIG